MRIVQIADGVTTTGAKSTYSIVGSVRNEYTAAIKGTGTFNVQLEGSFDSTNWVILGSAKNADEIFLVPAVPYVRINCVTMTGATVDAWVGV